MGSISNIGEVAFTGPSYSGPSAIATQVQPLAEDQVHLATVPLTSQAAQQLQEKEPPNLQEVLGVAIRNLRVAASQSSNQIDAAYFSGLADRFERLEDYGNAGSVTSSQSSAA